VQGTGCVPRRIVPAFSIRVRGLFRFSFMALQTNTVLLNLRLNGSAYWIVKVGDAIDRHRWPYHRR
jgi:hypothetical protein